MFIPALVGVFSINTLSGAILLGISLSVITTVESVFAVIERDTPIKFVILVDFITISVLACIMTKYYFKREDLVPFVSLSVLAIITVFCEIELIRKRRS